MQTAEKSVWPQPTPHEWYHTLSTHLHNNCFEPTAVDLCIYVEQRNNNHLVVIAVYVDDCTIIVPKHLINNTKEVLHRHFKMKDLGEASSVLGIEIH
jgi:hypothetical protein